MGLKDLLGFGKNKKKDRAFVNRAPRVHINYLHKLEFNASSPLFSAPLKIDNISSSGIGLILPNDADVTSLFFIEGKIQFADSAHHLVLQVMRFNGDHVGVSIQNPPGDFVQALNRYFESEITALQLRATAAEYLKAAQNGIPHWYQGSNNCDLSYISNGSDVVEFSLTVFGNHLEGGLSKPLRYSEISEATNSHSRAYKAADILNVQREVDPDMLVLAKRVIHAVEGLPDDHRAALLKLVD